MKNKENMDLLTEMNLLSKVIHEENELNNLNNNDVEFELNEMLDKLKKGITNLFLQGIQIKLIEEALFYNWLKIIMINGHGFSNEDFEGLSNNLNSTINKFIKKANSVSKKLPNEENLLMKALRERIEVLKSLNEAIESYNVIPQEEIIRQFDIINKELSIIVEQCIEKTKKMSLVEGALLYNWLRLSTITSKIPETLFQKLDRNWSKFVCEINKWLPSIV